MKLSNTSLEIVAQDDGVVIKQIIDYDVENGIIIVHSLKDYYHDYTIGLRDVQWLFNVTRIAERKDIIGY